MNAHPLSDPSEGPDPHSNASRIASLETRLARVEEKLDSLATRILVGDPEHGPAVEIKAGRVSILESSKRPAIVAEVRRIDGRDHARLVVGCEGTGPLVEIERDGVAAYLAGNVAAWLRVLPGGPKLAFCDRSGRPFDELPTLPADCGAEVPSSLDDID